MLQALQIILILFALFALSRAFLRFKEGQIRLLEIIFWSVLWIVAIIAIASPDSVGLVSTLFGIGRPVDFIMYIAIALLFYSNFRLYVALDETRQEVTKLVREITIRTAKKK